MRYEIKYATTQKTQNGNLITFGVIQRAGGNGTPEVPGAGGKDFAFFNLNHQRVERETWNKQQKNFEKLQKQTQRLLEKYGFGCAGKSKTRTGVQDNLNTNE